MNTNPQVVEQRRQTDANSTSRKRRLSDTILVAFHIACDQHNVGVASSLLQVLEFMAKMPRYIPIGKERRTLESVVAGYERLWLIQHPAEPHEKARLETAAQPIRDVLA